MARKVGYLPHSEARNYFILLIFASSCYVEAPNIHKTGYGPDIADPKTGMISIFFYPFVFLAAGSYIFLSSLATKLPAACYELQKRWSVICLHRQMKFPSHSMITQKLFFTGNNCRHIWKVQGTEPFQGNTVEKVQQKINKTKKENWHSAQLGGNKQH